MLTRREFGKYALATLPAATVVGSTGMLRALAQAKPNSLVDGVQLGAITYSFRSMPDQSAEATLRYIVESGISAVEIMGGPVESFAGIPTAPPRGGGPGVAVAVADRVAAVAVLAAVQAPARPRFQKAPRWATGTASRVSFKQPAAGAVAATVAADVAVAARPARN